MRRAAGVVSLDGQRVALCSVAFELLERTDADLREGLLECSSSHVDVVDRVDLLRQPQNVGTQLPDAGPVRRAVGSARQRG